MASEAVNGDYMHPNGQGYDVTAHNFESHSANHSVAATNDYGSNNSSAKPDYRKDEVGWYFVEQYYTNLSKSPDKLYLFYNKASQFVSGTEAEKVSICAGQKAINDRIKELDFQDCKVRVTNVDSQGSGSNIVIQVIGEISNKSQPHRKFTQTFVLAEQLNGYFVLNDIFRYIIEDDDYEPGEEADGAQRVEESAGAQEPAPTTTETAAHTLSNLPTARDQEQHAQLVDRSLEATQAAPADEPLVNGTGHGHEDVVAAEDAPVAAANTSADVIVPEVVESVKAEDVAHPEKPQDPEPTPTARSPTKSQAAPAPAPQAKPSGPKTWATIAGGNRLAPAVPAPAVSPTASAAATKPAPVTAPAQAAAAATATPPPPAAATPEPERAGTPNSGAEWQTAGHEHSRKQSKAQAGNQTPAENSRGYIKNVTEAVDQTSLQSAIGAVGNLIYIDINRPKNCAFVDFKTPADYRAAVAASPFEVNGQSLFVEERRVRPFQAGGFQPRGGARGGRGGQNGGQARGGAQKDAGRGNFNNRGRGNTRGRGGAVQAA